MNRDPFLQDFPLIIELKQIHNHSIDNLSHLCRSDVFGKLSLKIIVGFD